jgi:beta-galactosidase
MIRRLLSVLLCSAVIATAAPLRIQVPFNDGWKFVKGDYPGASAIRCDDERWDKVTLPHTWNAKDGQDGGNDYYRGPCWYRNTFRLVPVPTGKRLFIRFGAAGTVADVFVNGSLAGRHRGGYGAFAFDITALTKPGEDNVLAVKVDNSPADKSVDFDIPPLQGDFTICGGLHRTASLIITDQAHIDVLDHASPGISVFQDSISEQRASFAVRVKVRNQYPVKKQLGILLSVTDADGRELVRSTLSVLLGPSRDSTLSTRMAFAGPKLWNGRRDPYLHHIRVALLEGSKPLDEVDQALGFRFFRVDPRAGFVLNGKPYPLHGVNRHEDRQDKGAAVSIADREEDMRIIRELGATVLRCAHYQHDASMYDICDREGIIVWAELPLVDRISTSPGFAENAREQLLDLVRQNINHPSICFWSVSNEIYNADGPDPVPLLTELNAVAKKEDPLRPTTNATNKDRAGASVTDLLSVNFYPGWYHGSAEELGTMLDTIRARHPDRQVGISEYGAGASIYQHEESIRMPRHDSPWHPEEYQAAAHELFLDAIAGRPWLWISTLWTGFDFASDRRDEGFSPGVNDKGLVTRDRAVKKDAYYWYKSNWNPEPMVYITDKRFTKRDCSKITVKVYSNAAAVELTVNGQTISRIGSNDNRFIWKDVPLKPGSNIVRAFTVMNGRTISDQCTWRFGE